MYYGAAPPAGTYRACDNMSELCVPTSFLAGTNILQGASPIALGTNKSYCFETQQLADTSVTNFLAVTAFQNNTTTIACPHYQCESDLSNVVSYTLPPATGTFLIQTSAGSGGTVSPNGNIVISQGVSQSITITPNACNKIATLTVDGASVAAASPYLFSNIIASHTLNATFASLTFSVNATVSGVGGTITPANYSIVSCGASPTFTITPSAGYQVSNVIDTGVSKGALTSYTATNVIANRTITATFTPTTFAMNVTKSGTGTGTVSSSPVGISCGATCSANYNSGTNVTLTATPATGSTFTGWTGACTGATPTCTVAMNAVKTVGAGFDLTANNNNGYLMWKNTAGDISVWQIGATSNNLSYKGFSAIAGWSAIGYSQGADGNGYLMWRNNNGNVAIWKVGATTTDTGFKGFNAIPGWTATSYSQGADGNGYLMWKNTAGDISVWQIGATSNNLSYKGFSAIAGWSAIGYSQGADGNGYLMWRNNNGNVAIWKVGATTTDTGFKGFNAIPGWTATSYSQGADGNGYLMWKNTAGDISVWQIGATSNNLSYKGFSAIAGWSAIGYN
jgi:hypothetical protein